MASRKDGRGLLESRQITAVAGGLERADGSGRFSFGPVSSLASFSGPIEVRIRDERVDRATLEVVHRPLDQLPSTSSKALISAIDTIFPPLLTLSNHPRSLAQLVIQSLSPSPTAYPPPPSSDSNNTTTTTTTTTASSSSSTITWPRTSTEQSSQPKQQSRSPPGLLFSDRAASLNSASLAIMHASSINMRAIPFAVSLAYIPSQTQSNNEQDSLMVLDPDAEEETIATSRHLFGWAFGSGISGKLGQANIEKDRDGDVKIEDQNENGQASDCELVWAESDGKFTKVEFENALEVSKRAAREVIQVVRIQLAEAQIGK